MTMQIAKRNRGRPRKVTQDQINKIVELHKQKKGYTEIGKAVGLTRWSVRYYVKKEKL